MKYQNKIYEYEIYQAIDNLSKELKTFLIIEEIYYNLPNWSVYVGFIASKGLLARYTINYVNLHFRNISLSFPWSIGTNYYTW